MSYKFSRLLSDQKIYRHSENPVNPLVSIVMPTYKLRGDMNRRAIDSVINQTFRDFEFILVDDGSVDGLFDLLKDYQKNDPRIVIVRHSINSGLPTARLNEGFLLSKGKYLAYMFEDDQWDPNGLMAMVDVAERFGKECLVYGKAEYIIHSGNQTTTHSLGAWNFNYAELKHRNYIAACAVLHNRSILDKCGLPDPHILARRWSDYDLWLRMAKIVPFIRCHDVIARVEAGTAYSLGASIDLDIAFSYRYMNINRNAKLLPSTIHGFDIDEIPFITSSEDAYRVREHYIVPFWIQHPTLLTTGERKVKITGKHAPNRVLITKGSYATSIDVTLGNLADVLPESVQTQSFFPEDSLPFVKLENFDTVVFHKSLDKPSIDFQERMRLHDKTSIYLLDDNLLKMGVGNSAKDFPYMQPGKPHYENLETLLRSVDGVLSFSQKISDDVRTYNNRIFNLRNTIKEELIRNANTIPGGKSSRRRLKYAIFTGPIRKQEIKSLWNVFKEFFSRHKNDVEFHLWGLDISEFGSLPCPTYSRPFENSYEKYLIALCNEKFDFMLSPIFGDDEAKLSKTPIKYLEGTACGAVGIYSDVLVYEDIKDGVTGLKTSNSNWLHTLEKSWQMSDEARVGIFENARQHIISEYTTESQCLNYLTAFESAELHKQLKSYQDNGKATKIAYFFHESVLGGATIHLFKHALMAKASGFDPVLCFMARQTISDEMIQLIKDNKMSYEIKNFFCTPWIRNIDADELGRSEELGKWLQKTEIKLIHQVTYSSEVMHAAKSLGIPLVVSLHNYYDTPDEYREILESTLMEIPQASVIHSSSNAYARKWGELLDLPNFCMRAPIEKSYFNEFKEHIDREMPSIPTILVSGTLQSRKRQLEAIRAIRVLFDRGYSVRLILLGYDTLLPDYAEECRAEINRLNLGDWIEIPGFSIDPKPYYDRADFIFCPSDDESMPQSILKAMAAGIRVVSTPVGGVKELILDGFSGIITNGYSINDLANALERAINIPSSQWKSMLENAHFSAMMCCSEEVIHYQLLRIYNIAVGLVKNQRNNSSDVQPQRVLLFLKQIQLATKRARILEAHARRLSLLGLIYHINVQNNYWNGLTINFGTFLKRFDKKIEISIREEVYPYKIIRKVEIDGKIVVDNEPITLSFEPVENIAGSNVYVCIRAKTLNPFPLLAVYELGEVPKGWKRYLYPINYKGAKLFGDLLFAFPDKLATKPEPEQ